ncbi:glycosyltransferase [Corticibacter populi]|uniref:Glycosyltransferase n=1 Tax=Corticibacter populi TaxID=1550736 RepID=A0A3M6QMA5_9BURK|nr:glycosyltransferase [Corticibacter populi]RMX03532.1 glycosyltransferase [Corticibacter populi]RZS29983.1 glycosyltransferase involved in cell wall biosynthesis [Corticibacter populi]
MRIALLAPLPPEKNGIADYASQLVAALRAGGTEVALPLQGTPAAEAPARLRDFAWHTVTHVHAEIGGGRNSEFDALRWLARQQPQLSLSATVHDPERLIWRPAHLPFPLSLAQRWPAPWPQAATLLADPWTLRAERRLARQLDACITLTHMGGHALATRMRIPPERVRVIAHGNASITPQALPGFGPDEPLKLLYFGFIYRGKGIEDLLDAMALVRQRQDVHAGNLRLTLAGGTAPETAFAQHGTYLDELRARILRLGLTDCIDWQLDLPARDIAAAIQTHHVMALPYRESRKLALLGRMLGTSGALSWANACGRGVISSDARAFAEEVSSGNGLTYPQGDVAALAERLTQWLANPSLAAGWAGHAARIGAQRTWPVIAAQFRQLFETLQARHAQAARHDMRRDD